MEGVGQLEREGLRTRFVGVRFSENEYDEVVKKAREARLPVAVYCREASLKGQVVVKRNRRVELDSEVVTNLYRLGTNLNQLAKHLNATKARYMTYEEVVWALGLLQEIKHICAMIFERLR